MPLNRLSTRLIFVICLFTSAVNGQKFKIAWGDNSRINYDFDDAVPLRTGDYMVLKIKARGSLLSGNFGTVRASVLLVDQQMTVRKEMELPIDEKEASLHGLEKFGDNVFIIYDAYNRSDKTTSVYALRINEKTLAVSARIELGKFDSDSRSDQADATYKLSADSSKVLLFVEGPEKKKENKKYFIGVYDTGLKNIWQRNVELPIGDRYVSIYDQDITNDGKVFVAIKHYDKEVTRQMVREEGSKVPSYVYKLLAYSSATSKEKEISLNLNDHFIQGTKLIYNSDGSITAAGLYKKKYNGNITGAFYTTFDGNATEVKQPKMVAFPSDMITFIDKDDFGSDKDSDPGLYSGFKINHILYRNNGSVDLISEYYKHVHVSRYNASTNVTTDYEYYTYGDIVNINLGKDGGAVFTRIPKRQEMQDVDIFLGYYPVLYKDKLVLLYNDDEDNITRELSKSPDDMMRFKKSVFAAATIDAKGNLSRQSIYSHRDEDFVTMPQSTARISDTKYLGVSDLLKIFKKRTRFGVLEIK